MIYGRADASSTREGAGDFTEERDQTRRLLWLHRERRDDAKVFLHHILESISLIEDYSNGKALEDFVASTSLQDMIIRRIEIIGEAVKNLPDDLRIAHPEIPW